MAQVGILPAFSAVHRIFRRLKLHGDVELGQQYFARQGIRLHALQQGGQMQKTIRNIGKSGSHFRGGGHVEAVVGHAVPESASAPNGRCFLFRILDAQQDIVRFGLCSIQIKRIVGRYKRNVVLAAQFQKGVVDGVLLRQAVAVQFRVKPIAKHFLVPKKCLFCLLEAHIGNEVRNFARQPSRQGHYAFGVLHQKVFINPRDVVKSVDIPCGT